MAYFKPTDYSHLFATPVSAELPSAHVTGQTCVIQDKATSIVTTYVSDGISWHVIDDNHQLLGKVDPVQLAEKSIKEAAVELLVELLPDYISWSDYRKIVNSGDFSLLLKERIAKFFPEATIDLTCIWFFIGDVEKGFVDVAGSVHSSEGNKKFDFTVNEQDLEDYWSPSEEIKEQIGMQSIKTKYTMGIDPATIGNSMSVNTLGPTTLTLPNCSSSFVDSEVLDRITQLETQVKKITEKKQIRWKQSISNIYTTLKARLVSGRLKNN